MFSAPETATPTAEKPRLQPLADVRFRLEGEIGRRLDALVQQWVLPAPYSNPGMLEMFRRRDRKPLQQMVPWAGEFAGKYLTHAVQILRMTGDAELQKHLRAFVGELVSLQDAEGYLGAWPKTHRFSPDAPNTDSPPWDAWSHYHIMLGLLLWHETSGDVRALRCARLIGDMLCMRFLDGPARLHDTAEHEMNQAPVHSLALLHRVTGESRFLDLALKIVDEFALPPAGNYLQAALDGQEFWESPKPRWESLHPIMGLAELYYTTGNEKYAEAFKHWWWSMLKGDRHNTGGFTSGEKATGDPYHTEAIETCCTIAWMAMSVEMLRLTGDPKVADELELSMFNSGLGAINHTGRWSTYNTPMNGSRNSSAAEIVFQVRPGTPELNCCSVNAPRALGMLSDWAVMEGEDGLTLNYYGPGTIEAHLPDGTPVRLKQNTQYPREGNIEIRVELEQFQTFALNLRIPNWSRETRVSVNGRIARKTPEPGEYLRIEREWQSGDRIDIGFDFSPHYWVQNRVDTVDWDTEWLCFGPAPVKDISTKPGEGAQFKMQPNLDGLRGLPSGIAFDGAVQMPRRVQSVGGVLNFRELVPEAKGETTVVGFTTVDCAQPSTLPIAFTADWRIRWWVNGKQVFDNYRTGNGPDFTQRSHKVELPLTRGFNTISFCLSGGRTRGTWLSIGRGPLPPRLNAIAGQEEEKETGRVSWIASMYRGPLLLAYDPRFNPAKWDESGPPPLDSAHLQIWPAENVPAWPPPWMLLDVDSGEDTIRLCDFASAAAAGQECRSWLSVWFDDEPSVEFSHYNPLRTFHPYIDEQSPTRRRGEASQDSLSFQD